MRIRRFLPWGGAVIIVIGVIAMIPLWLRTYVREADLLTCEAEVGTIESAVTTNGKIVPGFEEIIVSPVPTRILEVYAHEGDRVAPGTPLLRLDTESAQADWQRMADELAMKRSEIHSQTLNDETRLTDLEMRISTKQLAVDQLEAEYKNEIRLDSIGSGTGERVRQTRLAWQTADLELRQLRRQLANERRIHEAMIRSKQLEGNISERNLAEASRTLQKARVEAPHAGTVTFLASSIGATVGAGERLAVLSDLSKFKAEGEIPEGHADKLTVGAPVEVRVGNRTYSGRISRSNAQSKAGVIPFVVSLDSAGSQGLRAGITARISVVYDEKPDVTRIRSGAFFKGSGDYFLYVRTSESQLERRKVRLAASNPDYIEVVSGLKPGEIVVISGVDSSSDHVRIRK